MMEPVVTVSTGAMTLVVPTAEDRLGLAEHVGDPCDMFEVRPRREMLKVRVEFDVVCMAVDHGKVDVFVQQRVDVVAPGAIEALEHRGDVDERLAPVTLHALAKPRPRRHRLGP